MNLSLRDNVVFPLRDSAYCMAGVSAKSVATIRAGVAKHANDAVSSVLRSAPPSSGFFFGNPSSEVKDSLNFAMMDSLIARPKAAAAPKPYAKRPATAVPRAAAPAAETASTSKSSSYSKGNYRGRSDRGKGGGRK